MIWRLAAVLCLAATALGAEVPASDGVAAEGPLPDQAFFRLVTCGASPGGACRGPVLRWPKSRLTLAFRPGVTALPAGFAARLGAAIDHALREINAAGMALQIVLTNGDGADITIRPTSLGEGARLTERPGFSGVGVMGVGYMTVWSDDNDQIIEAVILISTTIAEADMTSVVLEEITQSLGILFDIENPWYEDVSILSQTSNAITTIQGQDAALLRWLYPTKP